MPFMKLIHTIARFFGIKTLKSEIIILDKNKNKLSSIEKKRKEQIAQAEESLPNESEKIENKFIKIKNSVESINIFPLSEKAANDSGIKKLHAEVSSIHQLLSEQLKQDVEEATLRKNNWNYYCKLKSTHVIYERSFSKIKEIVASSKNPTEVKGKISETNELISKVKEIDYSIITDLSEWDTYFKGEIVQLKEQTVNLDSELANYPQLISQTADILAFEKVQEIIINNYESWKTELIPLEGSIKKITFVSRDELPKWFEEFKTLKETIPEELPLSQEKHVQESENYELTEIIDDITQVNDLLLELQNYYEELAESIRREELIIEEKGYLRLEIQQLRRWKAALDEIETRIDSLDFSTRAHLNVLTPKMTSVYPLVEEYQLKKYEEDWLIEALDEEIKISKQMVLEIKPLNNLLNNRLENIVIVFSREEELEEHRNKFNKHLSSLKELEGNLETISEEINSLETSIEECSREKVNEIIDPVKEKLHQHLALITYIKDDLSREEWLKEGLGETYSEVTRLHTTASDTIKKLGVALKEKMTELLSLAERFRVYNAIYDLQKTWGHSLSIEEIASNAGNDVEKTSLIIIDAIETDKLEGVIDKKEKTMKDHDTLVLTSLTKLQELIEPSIPKLELRPFDIVRFSRLRKTFSSGNELDYDNAVSILSFNSEDELVEWLWTLDLPGLTIDYNAKKLIVIQKTKFMDRLDLLTDRYEGQESS
ncbi:MAG: hypothetical protein KAR35_04535 [Candidatus Heimdallarchaeota archaeon]|nr:hypothetical protein [Candidatus Heimdallarchaeota archaeon]MCK5048623.1 hypothetical protein [Candidatus Heimdallarchaeota archaeon]